MKFLFGDIVVIEGDKIGVIVKSWKSIRGNFYNVYVRVDEEVIEYNESEIERYKVRHKYLDEIELHYQNCCR